MPKGVAVAAAFQNLSPKLLPCGRAGGLRRDRMQRRRSGRQVASELAEKVPGVRALNRGSLENARIVEQLTALLITFNGVHKADSTENGRVARAFDPRQKAPGIVRSEVFPLEDVLQRKLDDSRILRRKYAPEGQR